AGTPSCAPYLCDGKLTVCPTMCSSDTACDSKSYCAAGTCHLKQADGLSCQHASQCASDFCVDAVCCNTACSNACETCVMAAGATADGTCSTAAAGQAGRPSCSPSLCNGAESVCPAMCSNDSNCSTGYYCANGTCQPKQSTGVSCSQADECTSGFCVDGF